MSSFILLLCLLLLTTLSNPEYPFCESLRDWVEEILALHSIHLLTQTTLEIFSQQNKQHHQQQQQQQ
jgi:hypothetical protein